MSIVNIIILLVKFKNFKTPLKILAVIAIIFFVSASGVICSRESIMIRSLPQKAYPQNFSYSVSNEVKTKLEKEPDYDGHFNDEPFSLYSTEYRYLKPNNDGNSYDSYFSIYYYKFEDEQSAQKVFEDIIFFPKTFKSATSYFCYYPHILEFFTGFDDCVPFNQNYNIDAPSVLVKKIDNDFIALNSFSELYSIENNPLLAGLCGAEYNSACALKDENYITVIIEHTYQKESNVFDMLEAIK